MKPMFPHWLRILCISLFLLGLISIPGPGSADDGIPELLGSGQSINAKQADSLALRARTAQINRQLLEDSRMALESGEKPGPIALNMFEDLRLIARFNRIDRYGSGYTLSGLIDGGMFSEIHLSVVEDSLFASLNTHRGRFTITATGSGTARVIEADLSLIPECAEPLEARKPLESLEILTSIPTPSVGVTTTDDGSRIDVFVGYTDDARTYAGGTTAMQAMINTAISEANTGYSSSLVTQRVNLVGTVEYAYDEASFNWDTTLGRWAGTADGYMDSAHTTRNTLAADEMVLVVRNTAYCGIGYQMHSDDITTAWAPNAFALVSIDCLTGYYSFAHEMGHNMGAHHDRYTGGTGAYSYAHGYWIWIPADNKYTYRTIMAYDVPAGYGYDSIRVNRWSNPNITYAGQPTGKPTSDAASAYNALVLNNTDTTVARFRDGASPTGPGSLIVTGLSASSIFVDWTDVSGEWLYRIERAVYGGSWSQVDTTDANVTSISNAASHSTTDYSYRVLSDNGNGRTASPTVSIPAMPSNLTLSVLSTSSVRLTWTDHSAIETGFTIERAEIGSSSWAAIASTSANDTSHDLVGISTLQEYKYRVRAYKGSGYSAFTNTVNGLPAKPNSLTVAQVSMSRLRISWGDNSDIESGYRLERSLGGAGPWLYLTNLPANTITYDDADLPCETQYGYRVRAYNATGSSDWISNAGVATATCGVPPKPSPLTGTPLAHSIVLHWSNVDGEDDYHIYRCTAADCSTSVFITTVGRNVVNYSVSGLTHSTTYTFMVRAHNAYGYSALPNPMVIVTTLTEDRKTYLPSVLK